MDEFFEISMMFFFENRFISLWPLSVTKINGVYKLSTFSFPVLYPVEARNINSKLKKKLFLETVNIIRDLGLETGEIKFFKPFLNSMKLNFWQENAVKYEKYFSNEYSLYVKIQDNYNEIFQTLEKATKSLIKQAEKLWSTKWLAQRRQNYGINLNNYILLFQAVKQGLMKVGIFNIIT